MANVTHHSYHIQNRTDLNVFKKEAATRQKNGEPTIIHLHALSIDCEHQEHIPFLVDRKEDPT